MTLTVTMNICFTDPHLIRHSVILNCSFFEQSFNLGHYPLIYQLPKGVDFLNNTHARKKLPLTFCFSLGHYMHVSAVEMGLCTKIIIVIIIRIIIIIINCHNNSNNDIIPQVAREPIRIQSKPSL